MTRTRLAGLILIVAALLVLAGLAALHGAARLLRSQVEQALGPESQVGEIILGWSEIEVRDLRIRAPQGWPAADALRASRVLLRPDLAALLSRKVVISAIVVEQGYVSALRQADGRLRVVPSLLEGKAAQAGTAPPPVEIGSVELRDAVLEFFDATVRQPPLKIRLEQLQAKASDLHLPALDAKTQLHLDGVFKGVRGDGRIAIDGWILVASRESQIGSRLRDVDLVALQPYLMRAGEGGVARGRLDLDLDSTVHGGRMHAPGTLTLHGLELDSRGSTFMGLPRQAVVSFLKDRHDEIVVKFVLDGDLDDPRFRLNESFATRVASSLGDTLGISLEGIVRGAGSVGQKSLEAVGGAAEGVGKALKGLFGK